MWPTYTGYISNPRKNDSKIKVTDELLNFHRFGDSPFTDDSLCIAVADWTKIKSKFFEKGPRSYIYVEWNGSDSYHQAFSNAQLVAKASVEKWTNE